MRIDLAFHKEILKVFLDSELSTIELTDFSNAGINWQTEKFLFHFRLLAENHLISNKNNESGNIKTLGIDIGASGDIRPNSTPLRMTQNGHDFATILNKTEVFEELKENFQDHTFQTLFEYGKKLLEHIVKKKLEPILSDENP